MRTYSYALENILIDQKTESYLRLQRFTINSLTNKKLILQL